MLPKIMHHCAFLIITFSSYILCIQNGKSVLSSSSSSSLKLVDKLQRKPINLPEARQSAFHQNNFDTTVFLPSNISPGFRFPDKQQYSTNSPNELLPSFGYRNPYSSNREVANSNHLNNKNPYYPTPPHFGGYQFGAQRRPTYAQAFGNYLFSRQPNYNRRPTPPPLPPPPEPEPSYSPYQDGHLTGPYPYDDQTSPSSSVTGPSTYPAQYANQFGNFGSGGGGFGTTSPANPLGSLLNSIRGPFAGENPLSMQIIRGLENIARNDDLQCVPKVLCQMLGSPTSRAKFPGFITSPALARFVASLPSSSPALIYGRAALLGLSGGEYSCTRTYNKCPQNEDDILYYLNNHRGGFFKFFSEPDDSQDIQNQYTTSTQSYQQQHQQQQQSSQPSIFNFLTGLSPTSSSFMTDNNQGNMNSFMSDAVTNGIGSLFGNLISGFLGGQAATRRNDNDDDENVDEKNAEKYSDLIESNSTTTQHPDEQVEGRILNNKSNILAQVEPEQDNPISFPLQSENDNYETQQFQSEFRFPNAPHRETDDVRGEEDYRGGKKVNFIDSEDSVHPLYETKMIFPDRTGTGNLRFDNDEYFRVGKILNRPADYNRGFVNRESYTTTTTTRRPTHYYTKSSYSSNSGSPNRYASSNYYRQDYNQNLNQKQEDKEDTTGNVYVTNAQGVIEYYINASGKKIYV